MTRILLVTALLTALVPSLSDAGEIAGMPSHLPPLTRPEYTFFLGNDFFAPGTNDDFRTQQIIATARIKDRWVLNMDHSMLTRADTIVGTPARTDLMSLSMGYEVLRRGDNRAATSITIGAGVRAAGNFEGARIQNGFHTLIETGTSFLPYTDTRRTDATIWALAEKHAILREASGHGLISGWDTGYWVRAGALATDGGQLDAVAGVYAIATRTNLDIWAGVRRDWREGYDADIVQIETAAEESKVAISYGLRWGPLVLETVHRLDSFASYGQVSFVTSADTRSRPTERDANGAVQVGLYLPHMMFQLGGRWHTHLLTDSNSDWRETVIVDFRGGQPQLDRDVTRFTESLQLTAGLEYSRQLWSGPEWLRIYAAASLGWRSEQLIGRGPLQGIRSASIGKAVLQVDAGLEVDAARIRNNWRHSLRFGLSGWLPEKSAVVTDGGMSVELHKPGASIAVVWVFNYH